MWSVARTKKRLLLWVCFRKHLQPLSQSKMRLQVFVCTYMFLVLCLLACLFLLVRVCLSRYMYPYLRHVSLCICFCAQVCACLHAGLNRHARVSCPLAVALVLSEGSNCSGGSGQAFEPAELWLSRRGGWHRDCVAITPSWPRTAIDNSLCHSV